MAGSELSNNLNRSGNMTKIECAVCLQTSVHPAELPCGHIFCYLCIKGIVNQGRRCAMCRQDIPVDYLDKPKLVNPLDAEVISQGFEDGHVWFYEGHNGSLFSVLMMTSAVKVVETSTSTHNLTTRCYNQTRWWQYDERSSLELESAYQKGERCCDLLIAGFLYIADFDSMLQYRRNDPSRRRRIKRDHATTSKKGIAGLKSTKALNSAPSSSHEVVSNELIQNLPTSSSSSLGSLGGIRIFNSASNNSGQHSDQRQVVQMPQNSSGGLPDYPASNCRPIHSTNSNAVPQTDNSPTNFRNINLDNVLHDSLDWTIEQIESLDLELLNDYEALFRDVNSYGQLQDSLSQSRPRRQQHNRTNRYLNIIDPPSQSDENNLDTTTGVSSLSSSSVSGFPTSEDTDPLYSEVSEVLPYLQVRAASPVQPPSRVRGMFKSGSKVDSLRHPSNS